MEDLIDEIDDLLISLEDTLHGDEGNKVTDIRNKLRIMKTPRTYINANSKKSELTVEEAIARIATEMENDQDYKRSLQDNIAMAFKDKFEQYKKEKDKKQLSKDDRHIVANNAAEYLVDFLISTKQ